MSGGETSARDIDPARDERVDGYRLLTLLGEGGSARVYGAEELSSGRRVAVKRLRRTAAEFPEGYQRLIREAEAVRRLAHPGVVTVHGTGLDAGGYPYLVMELVEGRSLKARLLEGPLAPGEAWARVRAAAGVVQAAHEAGVLHRDLTPGNVLVQPDGRVRLTDFGLARHESDTPLTRTGDALGTPAYMAPEQWWGAPLDARTDVYGLGAVLYEALSGRPPWNGVDAGEMLHRIATLEPPSLRSEGVEVSEAVDAFVQRCLARVAADRPQSAAAFTAEGDQAFGTGGKLEVTLSPRPSAGTEKGTASGLAGDSLAPALRADDAEISPWSQMRRRVPSVLAGLVVLAAVWATGFRESHDPVGWTRLGGPVSQLVPLVTLLMLPALRWRAVRAVAPLLPLAVGALGTWVGFTATMRAVGTVDPAVRFLLFQMGLSESSANLFIGAGLSAAIATWLAWGSGTGLELRQQRHQLGISLAVALVGVLVAPLAGDAGPLAVSLLAAALIWGGTPARDARGLLGSVAAVGAMSCSMAARQVGYAGHLWQLERAMRSEALQLVPGQWWGLAIAILCSVAAVISVGRQQSVRSVPRSQLAPGLVGVLVCGVALAALASSVGKERQSLWAELAPRFSLWSELSPPEGAGRGAARVGPTLQIGRRMVAVDGQPVAPRQALEGNGRTGPLLVAQTLAPKLELGGAGPELVLACDRSVPWPVVARALGAARELGVRRIDVLYLPGPVPTPRPSAPAEASFVLPGDLRALEVTLSGPGDGKAVYPGRVETFGAVASRLAAETTPKLGVE